MLLDFQNGQTSVILRVKLRQDTTGTKPGNGITGLASSSTGLSISTIADNESAPTTYTSAGATIDTITTLGTYATPTAGHCEFREVSSSAHPGIYEIQIANARFAVSNAKSLLISITGVSGMADCDVCVPLRSVNPYDAVRFGMTALPNVASGNAGAVLTAGTGTAQINPSGGKVPATLAAADVTGNVTCDLQTIKTQTVTCSAGVTVNANVGFAAAPGAANGGLIAGSNAATTIAGLTLTGAAASGATPATAGLTVTGGAASTTGGGVASPAIVATGGAGAASTNGAASGATVTAGGTNTVASTADGITLTAKSNGSGLTLAHSGTGYDLNATTTNALQVDLNTIKTQTITCAAAVTFYAYQGFTDVPNAANGGLTAGYYTPTTTVDSNLITIKGQTVTCSAGVTVNANVGFAGAPGAANGGLIAGTNAATTFAGTAASGSTPATAGLTITGGAASTTAGGTSAPAIKATGGAGAATTNGAAAGVTFTAGGTTTVSGNDGFLVTATGNGNGVHAIGGASAIGPGGGNGVFLEGGAGAAGDDGGNGLYTKGGAAGTGAAGGMGTYILGGDANGNTFGGDGLGVVGGPNGQADAIFAAGSGAGTGFVAKAGPTGTGMIVLGGSTSGIGLRVTTTSGDGISITPTAGNGITVTANGTSKHGAVITGGTAGTSDGLKCVAGTGGVDIRGNITGNLSGTVTTVTTLTNLPAIPANWLTAAGVAAGALNGKGDWLLASSAPTNFASMAISAGGAVTVDYTTTITEAYPAKGAAMTLGQAVYHISQNLTQFSISGTTITVQKVDAATTAETYTLDSSVNPTSRTRAT